MGSLWLPHRELESPRFSNAFIEPAGPAQLNKAHPAFNYLWTFIYQGRNWRTNDNAVQYFGNTYYMPGRGVVCPGGAGDHALLYSRYPGGSNPVSIVLQYRPYVFDSGTGRNVFAIGYAGSHAQIVVVAEDNGVSVAWYGARTIAMKNELVEGDVVNFVLTVGSDVNSSRMFINGAERSWSYEGGSNFTRNLSTTGPICIGAGASTSYNGEGICDVNLAAIYGGILPPPLAARLSGNPFELLAPR